MNIIYRISDAGYNKVKPEYINNGNCLKNSINIFNKENWLIISDNYSGDLKQYNKKVQNVTIGHGAGTFNLALDYALLLNDNEIVYFIENDYLHKPDSDKILLEGFELGADYISLYDHPDKYMNVEEGGNPYIEGRGEITKVFLSNSCHWKLTNSTTMTFAAKVKTLREDEYILREFTKTTHPNDFQMFLALREKGRSLITPIPGYSTHGETAWLTPLTDWSKI